MIDIFKNYKEKEVYSFECLCYFVCSIECLISNLNSEVFIVLCKDFLLNSWHL